MYTTTNNCLYALFAAAVENKEKILEVFEVLTSPLSELSDLASAKKDIMSILKMLPDGAKLQVQFKSLFPRFFCLLCNPETVHTYLQLVAESSQFRESSLKLLQVIAEERNDVFMSTTTQIALFAVLQQSLTAVLHKGDDPLEGKKKKGKAESHKIRTQFIHLLATVSQAYERYPLCLVHNNSFEKWNNEYTTELLPLFDVLLDNLNRFELAEIKPITSIVSNFCRFIKSNDGEVDKLIRIRYNEWLSESLPCLSLQKPMTTLQVELRVVSRLLKIEKDNASHMGIRNLVEAIVTQIRNKEVSEESICVVCGYLVAYNVVCWVRD